MGDGDAVDEHVAPLDARRVGGGIQGVSDDRFGIRREFRGRGSADQRADGMAALEEPLDQRPSQVPRGPGHEYVSLRVVAHSLSITLGDCRRIFRFPLAIPYSRFSLLRLILAPMSDELFSVNGQVVLVSGASRGIGRGLAEGFSRRGAAVIVTGRAKETLEHTAQALCPPGDKV